MNATAQFPDLTRVDLIADRSKLAFYDSQSVVLPKQITPFEAWVQVMAAPLPLMKTAFAVRDAVSSLFGVKRIGGFSGKVITCPVKGAHLDFFLVERIDDEVMSLTARDTHLDVMTCITTTDKVLSITSSVVTHNTFGKAYMVPVAPAHRLIVRTMLSRLSRRLAQA